MRSAFLLWQLLTALGRRYIKYKNWVFRLWFVKPFVPHHNNIIIYTIYDKIVCFRLTMYADDNNVLRVLCCSRDGLWRKRIFYTVRYPSGTVWWITRAKVSSDGLFQKYSAAGNNRTNFPKTWVRPVGNTAFRGN